MADQDSLFTTVNLVKFLITTIGVATTIVTYFLQKAINSVERREAKIDNILEEFGKKITELEKHKNVQEYAATIVEQRFFRLENRVDKLEDEHRNPNHGH